MHIATSYLTLPPPASPPVKFWGIFVPVSERGGESDRLVYGPDGEGSGGAGSGELVVEVLLRKSSGRKKGVERSLEGWSRGSPCELTELESLKGIWNKKPISQVYLDANFFESCPELFLFKAPPDSTQDVSFNLNLTPSQRKSRAQVPLPYAHEGQSISHRVSLF